MFLSFSATCIVFFASYSELRICRDYRFPFSMIYVRQSLDNSVAVVRLNTECVRWISCLPYAECWAKPCPRVAFAPSFQLWLCVVLIWATLTKSGHNKICEVLRLGRLEILSASVSDGHRPGMVQTLSYTKIKENGNRWQIQQFRLKSQKKIMQAAENL